jgi:zinc protease
MKAAAKAMRNTLPGADDITRTVLPNGITVLARSNFSSLSVVVNGYLEVGSLFDSDEKLGLAHYTGLSLMRGTARRNFHQIYDALESAGASLGFGAGVHSTGFNGHALAEDLPLLLDLLGEALRQPAFPAEQVERLRAQLLTGLAMRAQDTQEMSSLAFDQIVYEGHPYRRPEDGYVETIRAIKVEDLAAFHRRYFGPRRMVIVIVGAVDPARAVEQVERVLGSWQNPDQPDLPALPPLKPLSQMVRKHLFIAGKSQSDLVMGSSGPARRSPDYISASLGNNILGQFGMMGRIGDVVREQSGLAYYASSSLNAGIGPGSWEVSAGVNPANLDKAIGMIQAEIRRFVTEPVSAEELSDSQANYIGRLPLSLESNGGVAGSLVNLERYDVAGSLVNLERYDLGLDYYRKYADMVHSATPASILETAARYLDPEKLAISSAGPEGTAS